MVMAIPVMCPCCQNRYRDAAEFKACVDCGQECCQFCMRKCEEHRHHVCGGCAVERDGYALCAEGSCICCECGRHGDLTDVEERGWICGPCRTGETAKQRDAHAEVMAWGRFLPVMENILGGLEDTK